MTSKKARIARTSVILFMLDTVITYLVFIVCGSPITVPQAIGYGGIPIMLIYWVLIFAGILQYDDPDKIEKDGLKE